MGDDEHPRSEGPTAAAVLDPPPPHRPPPPAGTWPGPPVGASMPPLPPMPPPARRRERQPRPPDPAPGRLLAVAVAGAIAFDLGVRGGPANVAVALGLAMVAVGLITDARLANRQARWLAAAALVPAGFLTVRSSPWLVAANLGAAVALLAGAVAWSHGGSVLDSSLVHLARRWQRALPMAWSSPRVLRPLVPAMTGQQAARARAVGRALAVALPVLMVVVALLASADAVFAGLLTPDLDLGSVLGHLALLVAATVGVVATVGAAAAVDVDEPRHGRFGAVEVATMLSLAVAVLGLFSVAQLVALTGAGDRLVASSGLTPAEYARSGFFQLCWATAILVGFLGVVRAVAAPGVFQHRPVRVLVALVPVLALALVAVSLRRMALYDAAFGLTMLRLSVVVATLWLGATLLLMAARNLGIRSGRDWLLAASALVVLVLVVTANVSDPEAFIVRHNLARADHGADVDVSYLAGLSDDAVPTLVDALSASSDPALREALEAAVDCGESASGATTWNVSVARAADARAQVCDTGSAD